MSRDSGRPAPETLAELEPALLAGEDLRGPLAEGCAALVLDAAGWERALEDRRPHLLLVESSALAEDGSWMDALPALLRRAAELEVPAVLWITDLELDQRLLAMAASFDRVFTTELSHLPPLREGPGPSPGVMTHAASAMVQDGSGERPIPVAWVGDGWTEAPPAWREALAPLLEAAAERDLRELVEPTQEAMMRALSSARVVIGADPRRASPSAAPPLLFDAVEHGAAVLAPPSWGAQNAFRELVPVARDRREAAEQLERLLGNESARAELVGAGRRVIRHNHTYRHRLATIASAAGYRILPCSP